MNGKTITWGFGSLCVGAYGVYNFFKNRKKPTSLNPFTYFVTIVVYPFILAVGGIILIVMGIMGQAIH